MTETNKETKKRRLELLDAAMGEFQEHGRVITVKCDNCDKLIEIRALSDTAWAVSCPCGTFNDTFRGI